MDPNIPFLNATTIGTVTTETNSDCMGLVRREAEGVYGIYHPRMLYFTGFRFPGSTGKYRAGTTFISPVLVTGNTRLFPSGTLPILEVDITEDLVRNMFSDMVDGETTVRPLRYFDVSGVNVEALGLCGNVNTSSPNAMNTFLGDLVFVEGKSRILDPLGNRTTMEVKTTASRTSIITVIFIGAGALGGIMLSFGLQKLWGKIFGATANISAILTSAISQISGRDCAMPAAVANGDDTLVHVNTLGRQAASSRLAER